MKATDLFVQCLEEEGVEYIFGIPGEETIDLIESLRKSSIKLIVTRHEQAATIMAATYGRLTGKSGVALSTLGPGATNLVTGVAFAQLGGMPLVVITGQKPIKKSKQGEFQIIDVIGMMRPLTKSSGRIHSGDNIPSLLRNAFKLSEQERPGAVHLEFPEDIAKENIYVSPIRTVKVRRPGPDPKAIAQGVTMIEDAKHPLIIIAAGANRKMISLRLAEFIRKTRIPFIASQMGKGVIDERSPQNIGTAALSQDDFVHCAFNHADVVIVLGHDVNEKPPAFMGADQNKKIIHINFYPAQVDDVYSPNHEIVGDISHSVWALTQKITPQKHWDFSLFYKVQEKLQTHIHKKDADKSFPILPQRFVSDLRKTLPDDAIMTLDNGMYKLWIARNYPAYYPNTVLLDNALATMGAGLPAAIAAKLVYPEKKIVAVCGDGGFMMNSQELETAVRLGLSFVVIILSDDGYGMIKWKQDSLNLPSFGLDFGNPDFVKYAESYGAHGFRLTDTESFIPLLEKCIDEKGVNIIEVPIDYVQNKEVFNNEIGKELCSEIGCVVKMIL